MTIHNFWTAPIIIVLGVILLYNFIGNAALVGVSVLVLSIPLQGVIAFKTFKAQKLMAKETDKRNNLVNEALQGIKILKLYGWEDSYLERIEKLRNEEVKHLSNYVYVRERSESEARAKRERSESEARAKRERAYTNWRGQRTRARHSVNLHSHANRSTCTHSRFARRYLAALMIFMFIGIPLALNLSVFAVHYALGGDMSPQTIYSAMALIGIIRFPLVMIPMTIQSAVSANLALGRMDRFFRLDEMEMVREACKDEGNSIELQGEYTWGETKKEEEEEKEKKEV